VAAQRHRSFPASLCASRKASSPLNSPPHFPHLQAQHGIQQQCESKAGCHKIESCSTSLSTWAAQLVGNSLHKIIQTILAIAHGYVPRRMAERRMFGLQRGMNLGKFRIQDIGAKYSRLAYYLTECMAGPRSLGRGASSKGEVVARQRQPHTIVRSCVHELASGSSADNLQF